MTRLLASLAEALMQESGLRRAAYPTETQLIFHPAVVSTFDDGDAVIGLPE